MQGDAKEQTGEERRGRGGEKATASATIGGGQERSGGGNSGREVDAACSCGWRQRAGQGSGRGWKGGSAVTWADDASVLGLRARLSPVRRSKLRVRGAQSFHE